MYWRCRLHCPLDVLIAWPATDCMAPGCCAHLLKKVFAVLSAEPGVEEVPIVHPAVAQGLGGMARDDVIVMQHEDEMGQDG